MAKKIKKAGAVITGTDARGHEVKKYQDSEGNWYVEHNNNGAVHPELCVDEKQASKLFKQYCEAD